MFRFALPALVLLALAPAAAQATLVFDREPLKPYVWVAADDGSGARKLAPGTGPRIAPDGKMVVYAHVAATQDSYRSDLMVVPADGSAAPRLLARGWQDPSTFAWSPDGTTVATVIGPELGARQLVLIDVAAGGRRTVARGFFSGVSFSPDGASIEYGRAPHSDYPPKTDI